MVDPQKFIVQRGSLILIGRIQVIIKLVSSLIRKSSKNMKIMHGTASFEGEMLHVEMDEQLDFAQLEYRNRLFFSLLMRRGYLRVKPKERSGICADAGSNKEVRVCFDALYGNGFNDMDTGYGDFCEERCCMII